MCVCGGGGGGGVEARCSSMIERPIMVRCVVRSISHGVSIDLFVISQCSTTGVCAIMSVGCFILKIPCR